MGNPILVCTSVLILVACALFAMWSGLAKSRIRGICVIVSAIVAVVLTAIFKKNFVSEKFVTNTMIPWLRDFGFAEAGELSLDLYEVVFNCVTALAAPLFCLALFLAFLLVTWIAYLIIVLILNENLRNQNAKARFCLPRALAWGFIQGFVLLTIFALPLSCYLEIAPPVIETVIETDVVKDGDAEKLELVLNDTVHPMNNGPIKGYRALGGGALTRLITGFDVNGNKTYLAEEIDVIAEFTCRVYTLSKSKIDEYGEEEAALIDALASTFERSEVIAAVVGEVVYGAADAWSQNGTYIGLALPKPEGDLGQVTSPFFSKLCLVLRADARDATALRADVNTIADMIGALSRHGVFENLHDAEALSDAITQDGVTEELIVLLEANPNMANLADEVTDMGMRAIATVMTMEDISENYGEFLGDATSALNQVKNMSEEEQIKTLSAQLTSAFEKADVSIGAGVVDRYSEKMIEELLIPAGDKELTEDDVKAYFQKIANETGAVS